MIHRGETRTVVAFGPWAFKFGHGRRGAQCNRHEAELYNRSRSKPHRQSMLCPVLWWSRSGRLQIARRAATPITQAQLNERKDHAFYEWDYEGASDDGFPFEWKRTDWGVLDGRIVAIDYAATVHSDEGKH
jgi:hypothetical protein